MLSPQILGPPNPGYSLMHFPDRFRNCPLRIVLPSANMPWYQGPPRDPKGKVETRAILCTDLNRTPLAQDLESALADRGMVPDALASGSNLPTSPRPPWRGNATAVVGPNALSSSCARRLPAPLQSCSACSPLSPCWPTAWRAAEPCPCGKRLGIANRAPPSPMPSPWCVNAYGVV